MLKFQCCSNCLRLSCLCPRTGNLPLMLLCLSLLFDLHHTVSAHVHVDLFYFSWAYCSLVKSSRLQTQTLYLLLVVSYKLHPKFWQIIFCIKKRFILGSEPAFFQPLTCFQKEFDAFLVLSFWKQSLCRPLFVEKLGPVFGVEFLKSTKSPFWIIHASRAPSWTSVLITSPLLELGISLCIVFKLKPCGKEERTVHPLISILCF